ncbi:hypothetical protein C8R43DRAFT_940625 [Mycena crocata]|nr:hypothetical protein C8R43DRAFT_940625 [Mycena crocata]
MPFDIDMNSSSSLLLDLPPELLVPILQKLNVQDIRSCRHANRFLHNLITGSLLLRYGAAKGLACVEDTQHSLTNYDVVERSEHLQRLQRAWLYFTPTLMDTILVGNNAGDIHEFAWEIYFMAGKPGSDYTTTSIQYARIATLLPGGWERVEVGSPIIDFATAVDDQNLVAAVTYAPHAIHPTELASVDIVLLDFVTQGPHPLATQPVIHVHEEMPTATLEINGDNVLLSIRYPADEGSDLDALHVYNWKSGLRTMGPVPALDVGATFLSADTVLVPNLDEISLDVYRIPFTGAASLVHSFDLPRMYSDYEVTSFHCRGAPTSLCPAPGSASPSGGYKRLHSTPEESIIVTTLTISEQDDEENERDFIFIFHRSALLRALQQGATPDSTSTSWHRWGPPITRWLNTGLIASKFLNTANGQRFKSEEERRCPTATIHPITHKMYTVFWYDGFVEHVVSHLPYVETISTQQFSYDVIIFDEDHVIGITCIDSDSEIPRSIEVLRFG